VPPVDPTVFRSRAMLPEVGLWEGEGVGWEGGEGVEVVGGLQMGTQNGTGGKGDSGKCSVSSLIS